LIAHCLPSAQSTHNILEKGNNEGLNPILKTVSLKRFEATLSEEEQISVLNLEAIDSLEAIPIS
jgi:hypothetical protein